MIYGLGMLESGITFDYGQLVLDCEFARMIKFTLQGIPVNDDTLAVDAIKEIGPGRDFLMHPTTFKGMRNQSKPELIDRRMRSCGKRRVPPPPMTGPCKKRAGSSTTINRNRCPKRCSTQSAISFCKLRRN
jgi:hypothetical protein